ncbi:CYTH and CHAD domain-containing protein [Rhodococcus sp. ZPP]|uniref:CYTH and CHAD domain-containing protein n=1 Tax=Rhodococcus sp. ZPP TaxID=2749906 RepID=UPI001AD87AA3|nr:CYTH and CHAD domain-containing protein [Rhodococcus sp. ZPP]QTJ67891.1 CYTH and CHAD domain-containing protein [Rhodococcus sp. ZPP]
MSSTQRDRDDRYDANADFGMPDLAGVVPPGGRVDEDPVTVHSDYFDTADRDLRAHRVSLRRRSGNIGAGWRLRVPGHKAHTDIRMPLTTGDALPDELATLVSGVALGKPVHPVATISTARRRHRILDADGNLLAEIADDTVRSTVAGGCAGDAAIAGKWREVGVELGAAGDRALLRAIGTRLTRAGARPARHSSKLSRALAPHGTGDSGTSGVDPVQKSLTAYLDTQVQEIIAGDVQLRRGLDPIHPTRVGIRRFRSTLRVFKNLLDPDAAARLDEELSWYAGVLGEVRDREVQRARFVAAVTDLPDELVLGPVAARIESDLLAEQLRYRAEVMATLDTERYRAILADLARWRSAPPLTDDARSGATVLKKAARKATRKADKRLAAALDDGDDEGLHRARKAAKRARYAAELTRGIVGKKKGKKKVAQYKKIQQVLGDHQDSVVALGPLRTLGARAGTTEGENGFTFGLLYGLELQAAQRAREDAAQLAS